MRFLSPDLVVVMFVLLVYSVTYLYVHICLQWFEDKIQLIENMEIQLKKLHESSETLVARRHGSYIILSFNITWYLLIIN